VNILIGKSSFIRESATIFKTSQRADVFPRRDSEFALVGTGKR